MNWDVQDAIDIGTRIGIDWDTAEFDPMDFLTGLEIELEHGDVESPTNVTDGDAEATGKIAWEHLLENSLYYDESVGLPNLEKQLDDAEREEPVVANTRTAEFGDEVYLLLETNGKNLEHLGQLLQDYAKNRRSEVRIIDWISKFNMHLEKPLAEVQRIVMNVSRMLGEGNPRSFIGQLRKARTEGYKVFISYSTWTDEDREIGDTDEKGVFDEFEAATFDDVLDSIPTNPDWQRWGEGVELYLEGDSSGDRADIERGETTYYNLFVTHADGSPLDQQEINAIHEKFYIPGNPPQAR